MKNVAIALLTLFAAVLFTVLLVALTWQSAAIVAVLLAAWLAFTRSGRQALLLTEISIATLPQRLGSASVVLVGIAGVVGVLVALLAMAQGFQATLRKTGNLDTAIILRAGSQTEINSVLSHEVVANVADAPQIMRDAGGRPIASADLIVITSLPKKTSGLDANVQVRGIGAEAWELRPDVRITAGRRFTPGLAELMVGKRAAREFRQTEVGSQIKLGGAVWSIVGEFESNDEHDSELWADANLLASAYRRGDGRNSVTVRLRSPDLFEAFKATLASDPRLKVDASTTLDYYSRQSEQVTKVIRTVGTLVAAIMAIGAVFGALNTMYSSVATRTREITTLRAIGFHGGPIVVSILIEALLLAVGGGIIGGIIAWVCFDNYTATALGGNFTQVGFEFRISPELLAGGLKWALVIGFIGGLFPAVRAAQMAITDGLRAL